MLEELEPGFGIELQIEKGIPIGSGIGGSAASAVAGVLAANALLGEPLSRLELLKYAILGEKMASGAVHADNVAPALLGSLVLIRSAGTEDVIRLPVPSWIRSVVCCPSCRSRRAKHGPSCPPPSPCEQWLIKPPTSQR